MSNPFDQFDGATTGASNPFDQFDAPPANKKQNKGIAGDLVTDFKRGIEQVPGAFTGLADIPVAAITGKPLIGQAADALGGITGFVPSKWAKDAEAEYSPGRVEARRNIDQAWEDNKTPFADAASGDFRGIGQIAKSYIQNPQQLVGSVVESLPTMYGGAKAGQAIAKGLGIVAPKIAAGIGEGSVMAGQQMNQLSQTEADPRTAAAASAITGITGGAIGVLGGKIASKLGVIDPDVALAGGAMRGVTDEVKDQTVKGMVKEGAKRVAGGAVSEGAFEELPQSVLEQVLSNLAQSKPWDEGVSRAAVEGTLAGALMGGAFNVMPPKQEKKADTPPATDTPAENPTLALPAPTYTGTPGDQIIAADADRQAAIDKAQAESDSIWAARDEYERQQAGYRQRPMPTIINDPEPIQQRIDALMGINESRLQGFARTNYEKALENAFSEQIGFVSGKDSQEIPFTMGDYLKSKVAAADIDRKNAPKQTAPAGIVAAPSIPVVGTLSAAANMAVQSGAHAAHVAQQQAAIQNSQAEASSTQPGKADTPTTGNREAAPQAGILAGIAAQAPSIAQSAPNTQPQGQGGMPATAQQGAPVVTSPARVEFDVSKRTNQQLEYLSQNGQPGWREAATAEIQRRGVQISQAQQSNTDAIAPAAMVNPDKPAANSASVPALKASDSAKAPEILNGDGVTSLPVEKRGIKTIDRWSAEELQGRLDRGNLSPESEQRLRAELAKRQPVKQSTAKESPLMVGKTPNAAEPVTVRNGVVHVGEYPAIDYETEADITVPNDATPQQIADALRNGGALGSRKIFGLKADEQKPQEKPAVEDTIGWTRMTTVEREGILKRAGYEGANNRLNLAGVRLAKTPWESMSDAVRAKLEAADTTNMAVANQNQIKNEAPAAATVPAETTTPKQEPIKNQSEQPLDMVEPVSQPKTDAAPEAKQDKAPAITPQHVENGESEPATAAVVEQSLMKGAANSPLDLRQERDLLLKKVDSAIAAAPTAEEKDAWNRVEQRIDLTNNMHVADTIGYRIFEVPGDGKFKVLNLKEALQRFRERVETNPGFRKPISEKPKTVADWQKTGRGGTEGTIKELLDAGEYSAAVEYAKQIGKPLVFGQYQDGSAITVYTDAKPFEREGYDDFNMVSVRNPQVADKVAWAVVDLNSGLTISSKHPTRLKAIAETNKALEKTTPAQMATAVRSVKANTPGLVGTQEELEQRWLANVEQREAEAQAKNENENSRKAKDPGSYRTQTPYKQAEDVKPAAQSNALDATDYKGFKRVDSAEYGKFELRDGNMVVKVEANGGGKYQASFGSAKSSPHLVGEQGAVDWAASYRDAARQNETDDQRYERIRATPVMQRDDKDVKWANEYKGRQQKSEAEAEAKKAEEQKAAIKADSINGFLDGKAPMQAGAIRNALNKQWRFDGVVMTARDRIESLWRDGKLAVSTYEENKIKPMSRRDFNRASQREQDAHEKKMREAGTKTVYVVSESELGKIAHDYAQHLLAKNAEVKPSEVAIELGDGQIAAKLEKPLIETTKESLIEQIKQQNLQGWKDGNLRLFTEKHGESIKAAMDAGKTVPDDVLADYPGLIRDDLTDDQRDKMADDLAGIDGAERTRAIRAWSPKENREYAKQVDNNSQRNFRNIDALNPLTAPVEDGNWFNIGGKDWQARNGYTGRGWALIDADKKTHPTINNIDANADLIREIVQANESAKSGDSNPTVYAKKQDEIKQSPRERGAADFSAGRERIVPDDLRNDMAIEYNRGYAEAKNESDYLKAREGKEVVVLPREFPLAEVDSSYSHISHSGTSRARSDRDAFVETVNRLYDEAMKEAETDEQKAAAKRSAVEFKDEYLRRLQAVIRVRGQTYSGFVAGRGNLNTKQANSRNSALDRALDSFAAWQRGAEPEIMQAVRDARNDDQLAAERKEKDDKAAKRRESEKKHVAALLNYTKGDGSKFGNYPIARVTMDRDGYPSSVTVEATDLTDNKFDIAKTLFNGDKEKLRAIVDEIRAEKASDISVENGDTVRQYSTMADIDSAIAGIYDGTVSLEDYKSAFNGLLANKEAITGELGKMTIPQLHDRFGKNPYGRSEKKGDIIDRAFEVVRNAFALRRSFGPNSYTMSAGGLAKFEADKLVALTELVNSSTAEDLKKFADEIGNARAARQEKIAAAQDPKTIEDFDNALRLKKSEGMTFAEARMSLTPEQRAEYDRLKGIESRDQRKARADQQKTDVRVASQTTDGQIIETKHTKTGEPLFVVKAGERVERDVYNLWNATAKRMGGYYSAFRGNGAVPGFQFKARENADAFLAFIGGNAEAAKEVVQERRDAFADDRSQSAVERLNEMADRLEERADESLGRERKANTERRARFAASAESAANAEKAMAKTMRRIAGAISNGTTKFLDRVRQKAQVEFLASTLRTAKGIELRTKYPSYVDQQRHEDEPATGETADYAEFPQYAMMRSDLANLARKMVSLPNMKMLGQRILKVADDTSDAYNAFAKDHLLEVSRFGKADGSGWATFSTLKDAERSIEVSNLVSVAVPLQIKRGEYRIVLSPSEAINRGIWKGDDRKMFLSPDIGEEIVEKLGRLNRKYGKRRGIDAPPEAPWQLENAYNNRKRLAGLGIEQPWEFRAALREFAALKEAPKEADKIKAMERAMIGRKNDGLDFFPTPVETAQAMIDAAEITEGMSVLEPSAGMGHIAEQIRDVAGIDPDVIEFNSDRRELLEAKGFNVIGSDFTELSPRGFTYGDVFRAPDGTIGVMRGGGGLGSNRVGLQPLDEAGNPDARRSQWVDRDSLQEVEKRGHESGYDRIIMNPPFSNRRDAEHVKHAYSLLRPGGRIVAIMGEGVFFGQDKKAQAFRDWLEEVGGTSEKLEDGTFLDPSLPVNTATNARMVVIDKPAGMSAPVGNEGAGNITGKTDSLSPADTAIYGMASDGKSAADILKFIASASRSPFNRQVAKLLMKTGIAPTITVGDGKGWKMNAGEGNKYAAGYNPKSDTISLFRPASAERNMLHELIHAATLKALSKKGMASAQMNALYTHVKKSDKLKGMYGMSDVDEFIAEAFSNPKFQEALKQVSAMPVGGNPSSAWDWFVRVVRGILGLKQGQDNALSQALDIGIGVMRENMRLNEGSADVRYNAAPGKINQTDTEAFKRWFGDSAVVDSDGKPLRVFHGTASDITAFDIGRSGESTGNTGFYGAGAYFSEDADYASGFSFWARRSDDQAPNVVPVYLSLKNPAYINITPRSQAASEKSRATAEKIISTMIARGTDQAVVDKLQGFVSENKFEPFMGTLYNALGGGTGTTALLKEAGFDGVTIYGGISGKEKLAEAVAFDPTQIKSAIGNNGDFDQSNPDIRYNVADDGWSVSEPSKMDDVIYALQDKQIDMKRVVQSIMRTGKKVKDEVNAYLQEELFHGRAAKGVKDFLDFELRPLLKQMQDAKVDMGDFEEYLWNRHAEERNKQIAKINPDMPDGGSGIETAKARAYLAGLSAGQRKTFEALAAKVEAINKASQKVLVESGLEKQSTIDAWNNAYQHYVPLQREDVDSGHVGTGKGFSVRGSSTKRAMGSGRQVVDIIANLTMQRERNIVRAEKNRVSNALLGLAVQNPNPDFWKVDQAPKERVVEEKAIYTVVDAAGNKIDEFTRMDEAERLANKTPGASIDQTWGDRVTERVMPGFKNRDNVLLTRINGKDHYIIFNERDERAMRMATAMKNLDMDNLGRVLSLVGKATRYLSSINTQYNPVFGVINLIRDAQGALINLSSTPLAGEQKRVLGYTKDALVGIYKDIRSHRAGKVPSSKWAALFEEFQKEGGQTGYRDQYANAEARAEAIKAELEQFKEGKAKQFTRGLIGWLSDYNETMENAVRLAAYKAAKEKGMSNQQAASLAKNITVNFNRKGQMATQVGALYAFFNASVQGTARIAETLFEQHGGDIKNVRLSKKGKQIVLGGIMLGSMQALLLAAAGYDDDEPPEFVRERNLILPIGDGKYLTLAMPLGLHVIPGIGRIATEFVLSGGKDPLKRIAAFGSMFADAFNPVGSAGWSLQTITPSVVDPFAALAENKDFTGKEIYREDFNKLNPTPGHARAKDVATIWSRYISEALNFMTGGTEFKPGLISWSPDSIDYLLGQATGGVGREFSKAFQTGRAASTGEDLPLYKIPLVGRFVGDTDGQSGQSAKFYDAIKQINMHEAQYKGLIKDGRSAEAREYLAENPAVKLIMAGNHAELAVRKLRTMKRDLVENEADPAKVRAIDDRITATMRAFNERAANAI